MMAGNRQLTGSDLNHTGKAEDPPCSQRSDRSRRVRGTRRARWPWAAAHWEVSVREKPHALWSTASSSLSSSLSPPPCRLFAASLSPNCKFSSLKDADYPPGPLSFLTLQLHKDLLFEFEFILALETCQDSIPHINSHILQYCNIIFY